MQTNEMLCIPHTYSYIYRHILLLIMVLNNCFHNYYNYDCDLLDQINFRDVWFSVVVVVAFFENNFGQILHSNVITKAFFM